MGIPHVRRLLGRPRQRWEENIKLDLELELEGMEWIDVAQDGDRWLLLMNVAINVRAP
jgi:hypothetical protein